MYARKAKFPSVHVFNLLLSVWRQDNVQVLFLAPVV